MNIIVCMKQIPSEAKVPITAQGTLMRSKSGWIIGKEDYSALEAALQLKDKYDNVNIHVLTMGNPSASAMLYETLGKGADEATLITDESYSKSDSLGTATILATALQRFDYDLIFFGVRSMDAANGSLPNQIAAMMDLKEVTNVIEFKLEENGFSAVSLMDNNQIQITMSGPAIVSFHKEAYHPRLTNIRLLSKAYEDHNITYLSQKDLNVPSTHIGWEGASTKVINNFTPEIVDRKGIRFNSEPQKAVEELFEELIINPVFNMEVLQ